MPDHMTCMIGGAEKITATLEKVNGMERWEAATMDGVRIDAKDIEHENSQLCDLHDATRKMIEQMMDDQMHRQNGLRTREEQKKLDLLAQFYSADAVEDRS
jgi:hypothetical protein